MIRGEVRPTDRDAVREIVTATGKFRPNEVAVAVELVDERLTRGEGSGYLFRFLEENGQTLGYACFGRITVTLQCFDLYWIAVRPTAQGRRIGRRLMAAVEDAVREQGGRRIYIETSSRPDYADTRAFYERCGYVAEATLKDFYAPGDDKVIFVRDVAGG